MHKRTFNIVLIAVLAINLMGVWAFASAFDCGMECCKPGDWVGTVSYEAPSCCQMDDITCGFETGKYEELLNTAICCHSGIQEMAGEWSLNVSSSIFSPSPTLPLPLSERSTGPPLETPIYLSNASFLC